MSIGILIIGESGSGKSSSLRNLDPLETAVINVLDKPLPFRGFSKNYIKQSNDKRKANYFTTDDYKIIRSALLKISKERPEIKNIIIDDFQYLMSNEYMKRATETGYNRFSEIAQHSHSVIKELDNLRNDIKCFILCHSEIDKQSGKVKAKTIGKMIDDMIVFEGMFTIVLHALVKDGKYKFLTQNDGIHTAKSPMEMFDEKYIDNDLQSIIEKIDLYFNEDIEQ